MDSNKIKNIFLNLIIQLRLFAKECLVPAVLLHLLVEMFARESLVKPFIYMFTSPLVFLYNTLVICATLSVSFFFKRRRFVRFLVYVLWTAIGVTDFILLQFRVTPFTGVDLLLLDSAFAIMHRYLSVPQTILLVIVLIAALCLGVLLFFRTKKETNGTSRIAGCLLTGLFLLVTILSTKILILCGVLDRNIGNLNQGFRENGLPYCFCMSIFNTGISRPASYSEEKVEEILAAITNAPTSTPLPPQPTDAPPSVTGPATPAVTPSPELLLPAHTQTEHPNFVFLQLESFFDPEHILGASFSETPVPYFRYLKETCPSGFLSVPSIGAGTANTEFEVISGVNLDFFGPGEYPYKTLLRDTACESIAFNLSAIGLIPHAIHNNDGDFYDRHKVFAQLGFSTFTPIEYMGLYETNPIGWPKDKILTREIIKSLKSTEEQDFIYTISVQGHGAYPDILPSDSGEISILSLPEELESSRIPITYYVNQLHEMDLFLKELTDALSEFEEEVVLVLYGDHLPAFPFTEELLDNGSLFETEYVIWSNRGTGAVQDCDLEAYALSAHVLNCYDIHEGLFTRFHQTQRDSETYLEDMEILEYDVLYGPNDSHNGINPYTATDLKFGTDEIQITSLFLQSVSPESMRLYVNGKNFTSYSVVYIDGKPCATTYINPQLVSVSPLKGKENDVLTVSVAQVGTDSYALSHTEEATIVVPHNSFIED